MCNERRVAGAAAADVRIKQRPAEAGERLQTGPGVPRRLGDNGRPRRAVDAAIIAGRARFFLAQLAARSGALMMSAPRYGQALDYCESERLAPRARE